MEHGDGSHVPHVSVYPIENEMEHENRPHVTPIHPPSIRSPCRRSLYPTDDLAAGLLLYQLPIDL